MRCLCLLVSALLLVNLASGSWLYDVFEEVKEGIQEGVGDVLKDPKVKEQVEKAKDAGKEFVASNWEAVSNKAKDIMTDVKEKAPWVPKLDLEHIHRMKWGEADLKKGKGQWLKKMVEGLSDYKEAKPEEIPTEEEGAVEEEYPMDGESPVPVLIEEGPEMFDNGNETDLAKKHHGKHHPHHGGHHGRHHGGRKHHHGRHHGGRHHGGHKHHGRGPHVGGKGMVDFHKRMTEVFDRKNSTRHNPFRKTWQQVVRKIQGTLNTGAWKDVHDEVKKVMKQIKHEATNSSMLARVPVHRIDWGELKLQKLENIFGELANKWGDAIKGALEGEEPSPTPTSEEQMPSEETPEELALVKMEEPVTEDVKPLVKLLSSTDSEYKFGMDKVEEEEKKIKSLESEWEAKVEKEEEEFTKKIVKDDTDAMPEEEVKRVKVNPGFPVHKGVGVAAPTDVEGGMDEADIEGMRMAELEAAEKPPTADDKTFSYMGIPAKIFNPGKSVETAETLPRNEDKSFFKRLAEERKEWLGLKQLLLKKLARMGKKH